MMPAMMPPAEISTNPWAGDGDGKLAAALLAAGAIAALSCALGSPDGLFHFDDVTHYLYAKWAWRWPAYLLNDWGRPGFTVLYFLPARFGWMPCRVLSVALSAGAAWLAYLMARRLNLRHAWMAVPLTLLQPLMFQLSQTTLTETPLAFYLSLAAWLAMRGQWRLSSAALSAALLTRHEAVAFVPVWALAALRSGVPLWRLWPVAWAPAAANFAAWASGLTPPMAVLFEPRPTDEYGAGGWLSFAARSMRAWGPGVTVLAVLGAVPLLRRREGLLPVACVVVYFVAQTVVRALGLFASGGYDRFLVPVGPLLAVMALAGWRRLSSQDVRAARQSTVVAVVAMLVLWLSLEREMVLVRRPGATPFEYPRMDLAALAVRILAGVMTVAGAGTLVLLRPAMGPRAVARARAILPATLMVTVALTSAALCGPLPPAPEAPLIESARQELSRQGLIGRPMLSACVWVDYTFDNWLPPDRLSLAERVESAAAGTLVAWERQFGESPSHGLSLSAFQADPCFREVARTPPLANGRDPYMIIFEKTCGPGVRRPAASPG